MSALVALALVGAAAPSARAVGLYASWWNIDQSNDDGFGFGLRQPVPITKLIAINTDATWVKFGDSDTNVFPLEVSGVAKLGLFYGGLGVGYYIFDASEGDVDNNFGWFAVGGIEVALHKTGIFGEFKYRKLSADIKDVKPGSGFPTSVDADGMGFDVGVILGRF